MTFRSFIAAVLIAFTLAGSAIAGDVTALMQKNDILPYLDQMIAWHRRTISLEVSSGAPRELLFRNSLDQHAAKALNASFDFARVTAGVLEETEPAAPKQAAPAGSPAPQKGIGQAIAKAQQQIQDMQTAKEKAKTGADKNKIEGEIRLAEEHVNLLKAISEAIGSADDGNDSLAKKIQQLAGTVPEIDSEQAKPPASATIVTQASGPSSSGGILALAGDMYGFMKEKIALQSLRKDTQALYDGNKNRSQAIREAVKSLMQQGSDLADGKAAAGAKPTFDDLLAQMKDYSKLAVELSQLNIALKSCNGDMSDWIDFTSQHIHDLLQGLLFRLAILAVIILGLSVLSMLAGRATKRYVLDDRRRKQLRAIRKGILAVSIGLVVFLAFFTDLNSLATFAGLITAGLAVALQSVLLSAIAYFQFFGPFGIRPGDRITISGVTGKVMQIGLLRFNLMELKESDLDYLPSGRLVGFSNSILFQPTPFFRQTPGINFVWNEIDLTLDASVDYEETYNKLSEVVKKVYARHSDEIKRQEMALQKLTNFPAEVSVPQTYLKITGTGIVMVIRYAVQREQKKDLHLHMTEELLTAIKKDPALKFVNIS